MELIPHILIFFGLQLFFATSGASHLKACFKKNLLLENNVKYFILPSILLGVLGIILALAFPLLTPAMPLIYRLGDIAIIVFWGLLIYNIPPRFISSFGYESLKGRNSKDVIDAYGNFMIRKRMSLSASFKYTNLFFSVVFSSIFWMVLAVIGMIVIVL